MIAVISMIQKWRLLGKKAAMCGGFLSYIFVVLLSAEIHAVETFPAEIPKTKGALAVMIKAVLHQDKAFLKSFKTSGSSASAKMKIKGEDVTLFAFKRPGVPKVLLAIVPEDFKLSTFVPIPPNTPVDGVKFTNVALVYVPKGAGRAGVSISGLPAALTKSFAGIGTKTDFKDGLNVFGSADFQSVRAVKKLMSSLGLRQFRAPLSGSFSSDILRYDLKSASQKLKEQLFNNLHLTLPLPKFKIPGMPNTVSIKSAHLVIVGKEVKGKRKIFAGVAGEMDVKLGNKSSTFDFGVLTGDKLKLTGTSKDTVSLPLFKTAELTKMNFTAIRNNGKWAPGIAARSKFNGKDYYTSVVVPNSGLPELTYSANLPLSDIAGVKIMPGLDDIKSNWIVLRKDSIRVDLNIKGIRTDMNLWKPQGSSKMFARFGLGDLSSDKIIPNSKNSPLKDATFKGLTFVFNPTNAARKFKLAQLPDEIGYHTSLAHLTELDTKPGFNMFGHVDIKPGGEIHSLLKHVGVNNLSLPLNGKISSKVLGKSDTAVVKNEILDSLDLNLHIPKFNASGVSKIVDIKSSHLSIKGKNTNGKRTVDVELTGELEVKATRKTLTFDYEVVMKKTPGQPDQIQIKGVTKPGTDLSVSLVEKFTLTDLSILVYNERGNWTWAISGKSTFRSKPLNVIYMRDHSLLVYVYRKLSLAEVAGVPVVPVVDDIKVDLFSVYENFLRVRMNIKGVGVDLDLWKPLGSSKFYTGFLMGNFSPDKFIPGTKDTPLNDVSFKGLTFINNPTKTARKFKHSELPDEVGYHLPSEFKVVTLKPGLNVFGNMDVHPAGKMETLLKRAGINNLNLPLNGTISPKAFSKNISGTAINNEILDNLDIRATLPIPHALKFPNHVKLSPPGLEIKGVKKDGKREIDVAVTGRMDVDVQNQKVAFFYSVETKKQAGKPAEVFITGNTEPGKKITLDMFHKFTLENLSLRMTKVGKKWSSEVCATSELRSKPVNVKYVHKAAGEKYLDIETKLTLADLTGQSSLPGLSDITAGFIHISDKSIRMNVAIKNTIGYVDIYKPQGASKHLIAVTFGEENISPAQFIPGTAKSPLKDVIFSGLSFVLAPKDLAGRMHRDQMPRDIAYRLRPAAVPGNIILKPGLNVFGKLKAHPSGALAKLLGHVGIKDLSFPLNGGFSPKVFAKNVNGSAIKNDILDNLDIQADLPKLAFNGMPKSVQFKNAHLAIKGAKKGTARGIDVGVSGELDVKAGNENVAFDFDVDIKKVAGDKTQIKITGDSAQGSKITADLVEKITVTDLSFEASNGGGHWNWQVGGKTTFRSKPVEVEYQSDHTLLLSTNMALSDVIGHKGIPVLDDIKSNWIIIRPNAIRIDMNIKGIRTDLDLWKPEGSAKYYAGFTMADFSPAELIPGTENSPLKDATFKGLVFVHSPAANIQDMRKGLPDEVAYGMRNIRGPILFKKGLNVFDHLDVHPTGEMAKLLKDVGISDLSLPLNGGFSSHAFAKNISGATIKNAILDNLDLKINLPALKIPEVDKFLTFKNGTLAIKGKTASGARGLDVALLGDADLKVKGDTVEFAIDVAYDKSGGASTFEFKGQTEKKWTHPLGITMLDLDSLKLDIKKKKKASGDSTMDIKVTAKSDIGSNSKLDVIVDVHETNGAVTDAFFELDGPLQLSSIPGVKDIPNASHFEIDTIKVSEHGIEAKTDFGGNKDLDVFLFTGSGWNLIIRQDNFAVTELVPPLKDTPLKHIVLSEAAIVLSKDGLSGPMSGFSVIAQDALKDIYGANAANIDVDPGLSLIASFEHKKSKGGMSDAFSRLGLSEERVILTGGIGGLFGGPTTFDLEVDLSAHTGAKSQPKWMKSKPGVEAVFSMIATEAEGNFDIEFGIGVDIIANVHGTELVFDAKTALEFEDEKIDVKIVAKLKDNKGWKKPFGIPGFTLYDVGFDLGIDEDAAIHLGFDGSFKVSGDKFTVAADADLLPEALGAPQDIAFVGSADKVDMFFMEAIAIEMISGGGFKLDIPSGILPTFTGVKFAFATPGAQDPDLNITGEGFALKGAMNWLDHEVGSMDIAVGPTTGIVADGKIDDITLGPISLTGNDFHLKAAPKALPSLKLDSNIDVIGIKEKVKVDFSKKGVTIDVAAALGPDISLTTDMSLSGIDLGAKKPDFKNADFALDADLKLDIGKFIAGPGKKAINDIFHSLTKDLQAGIKAVAAAQKKVDGLTTQINAEREKVRKEKAAAESRVRSAENRVNGLNSRLSGEWASYHRCHGWGKWPCRGREGIRIGWTETEVRVADEALNLVRSLISHFPVDLDPRVAKLLGERDAARGVLYLAKEAIEGLDVMKPIIKQITNALTNSLHNTGVANSINIKKASFKADLQGIIKKDEPVELAMDVELFGANVNDSFSFKLKDLVYDVEQVGMLGLYAIEHLIEKVIADIPGPLKNKLRGALASKLDAADASRKRQLAKYSKEFAAVNGAAKAIRDRNAAYNVAFLKAKMAGGASALDHDTSENFKNEMIEVGHTGLCLTKSGGQLTQTACNGAADQRWSTRPANGASGVTPGAGYVFIDLQQNGACIYPDGRWGAVTKSFSDPKLATEGAFKFQEAVFQGDGNIAVGGCTNSKEFYWKVLKHGNGWMQISNLATRKCVHFENSNAIPGKAIAKWKACTGAANQVFRLADNITPKYHKANIALRNDAQSVCFQNVNAKSNILAVGCRYAARYDYLIDIRGYIKFINTLSGKCLQPETYGTGAKLVERTCSQLDYQWWAPQTYPGAGSFEMPRPGRVRALLPPTVSIRMCLSRCRNAPIHPWTPSHPLPIQIPVLPTC